MEPHPTVALVRSYVERLEARDWQGLLAEVTDFWPTAYEPPADRAHLAEREPT